jgi:hypothetical protein
MKKRIFLLLALTLITGFFSQIYSQSHNVLAFGCKYSKYPGGRGAAVNAYEVCKICSEKQEKERKARADENQRRTEQLIAKEKAEAEERVRKEKAEAEERAAREAAEKKRKEEIAARLKQESEAATRNANEIRNRYKELNNVEGSEYENEIDGLASYSDKEYFGVKFNEDILWRKPTDNMSVNMTRITGTNYFLLTDFSKKINYSKIYDMYGKLILIDGEEWFQEVIFDKEKNIFKIKILEEPFSEVSSEKLSMGRGKHEVDIYASINDLLAVHRANVEADDAAWKKRYAGTQGAIFAMSYYLEAAKGTLIKTDIKFKILEKKTGYLFR